MNASVTYIIFNRPEFTEITFAAIREQKPPQLFIIADGPRPGVESDIERCRLTRLIVDHIDWECDVRRNYADINLGLKQRVSSGLNWVFGHVDRTIVLEDDCLACPDFFSFCDELLDRYERDERVSVITGNNFQDGVWRGEGSYYFSKYNHCWGWATWRRAWRYYDGELPFLPEMLVSDSWLSKMPDLVERKYWEKIFKRVREGKINSWAYPWTASVWYKGGLTATPNLNLVSNIGFGDDSTHTHAANSHLAQMLTHSIGCLKHPFHVAPDENADKYIFDWTFDGRFLRFPTSVISFPGRLNRFIRRHCGFN